MPHALVPWLTFTGGEEKRYFFLPRPRGKGDPPGNKLLRGEGVVLNHQAPQAVSPEAALF